jgi:hypothetical protein
MHRSLLEFTSRKGLLRLTGLVLLLLAVYAVGFVQGRSAGSARVGAVAAATPTGRAAQDTTSNTRSTGATSSGIGTAGFGGKGLGSTGLDGADTRSPDPGSPDPGGSAQQSGSGSGTQDVALAGLQATLHLDGLGIAYQSVSGTETVRLGSWTSGPAWSTMKVPVSIAALGQSGSDSTKQLVHRAIRNSDNAAADALWDRLGRGFLAASTVDQVLREHGDLTTATQSMVLQPGYSAFGQTDWSLENQVTFARSLFCGSATNLVYADMGKVSAGQRWGLGQIPAAHFKGGWGPDPQGRYLVRQFGIVSIHGRNVAVALAVRAHDGSFDSGTRALTKVTTWLVDNADRLPQLRPQAGTGSGGCRA